MGLPSGNGLDSVNRHSNHLAVMEAVAQQI
jgi:hypothetical protein